MIDNKNLELSENELSVFQSLIDEETYMVGSSLNGNSKAILNGVNIAVEMLKRDPFHEVSIQYIQLFSFWKKLELPIETKKRLARDEFGEEIATELIKNKELLPYTATERDFSIEYSYKLYGTVYGQIIITKCRDDTEAVWTLREYIHAFLEGKTEYRECEILEISTTIPRYIVKRIPSLYYQQLENQRTKTNENVPYKR